MNSLGFCRGSDLVMGHPSHIPQGWPNSIKWESWKSHKCQKPESRLIIKSILAANGITDLENFHLTASRDASVRAEPEADKAAENTTEESVNENTVTNNGQITEMEDKDETSHEGLAEKRKRKLNESDSETEEGELSLHYTDTDTDADEDYAEAQSMKHVMSEAERRRHRNIEERESLWEQQKEQYENLNVNAFHD